MNCPYCNKHIPGMTGYQEADNFRKHLNRCGKTPARVLAAKCNEVPQMRVLVSPFTIHDALEIRAASGQ